MTNIEKTIGLTPVKHSKETYLKVPIPLLNGMLNDKKATLDNMFQYAAYKFSLEKDFMPCELMAYEDSFEQLGGYSNDIHEDYEKGMILFNSINDNTPFSGLHRNIFWNFYNQPKDNFELVCLVAYLGIKSILGKQAYCKLNNQFMVSRMDGHSSTVEVNLISQELRPYLGRYQSEKLRNELEFNWGINTYGFRSRGFYASIDLPIKTLIMQVEKNRKSRVKKQRLKNKSQLRTDVVSCLENLS